MQPEIENIIRNHKNEIKELKDKFSRTTQGELDGVIEKYEEKL